MALIPLQFESEFDENTGQPLFYAAATGGDRARNPDDNVSIWIRNDDIVYYKLVFDSNRESNFGQCGPKVCRVAPGKIKITLTFDGRRFNDGADQITWDYTDDANEDDEPGDPVTPNLVFVAAIHRDRCYKD